MAYLYRHIRLDKNEPFYIGIGSDFIYKRANSKNGRNIIWNRIVSKSDYEVEIIMDNLTWEEACEKEKEFIKLYGRIDNKGILCNLTDGGEGSIGVVVSESSRLKKSIKLKNIPLSEEHKKKISISNKGKKKSYEHSLKCIINGRKNILNASKKASQVNSRKVIDLDNGITYDSITIAAIENNLNRNTLYGYLSGVNKNKTNLIYE